MPYREAKKAINELNVELKKIPRETSTLEGILEQAREEIERYTPEAVQDLLETLQRESEEFKVEHPRVTALINQLANTLSRMGI